MPEYLVPDVYVEEVAGGTRPIEAVGSSTLGVVGEAPVADANLNRPIAINNWSQFVRQFVQDSTRSTNLSNAVFGFFQNGGSRCYVVNVGANAPISGGTKPTGLDVLKQIDEVAIVAAPGYTDAASYDALLSHCENLKDRVAVVDAPLNVTDINQLTQVATLPKADGGGKATDTKKADDQPSGGQRARQSDDGYGAFYFPWIAVRDPLNPAQIINVPPSGHIAGIWARTDTTRGVFKAPANETVRGALDLTYPLTREEQGVLNPAGVNCIRLFGREGIRVWGARTLAASASEWRYLNVRRLFNMIRESIAVSTRWIVFEPNDQKLWKAIRRDVSAFLTGLWRNGALMGRTADEAFFVKCDEETNPPDVIDNGMVVTMIGIAPVKPAEFIIFRISQSRNGTEG